MRKIRILFKVCESSTHFAGLRLIFITIFVNMSGRSKKWNLRQKIDRRHAQDSFGNW
jgi:hypothetical protein